MSDDSAVVILMAEDNPADVVFFQEAAEAIQAEADLRVVNNGARALQFLRRESPYHDAPRPDVVVLDLNLPLKTGREVIAAMAGDPAINGIPVAVLTTSESESHVCDLYCAGRCLYFTKTDDFSRLQEIVKSIMSHSKAAGEG